MCDALSALRAEVVDAGAPEQLLHGEPHPDNVLRTAVGPLFTDFETCCSGPVEFDVADAPEAVAAHYPGLDPHLLDRCCWLVVAMVTSLCFGGYERHENLRRGAEHFYGLLAAAVEDGSVTL